MKRLFSSSTMFLWGVLATAFILYGGQLVGINWHLPSTRSFGRLLLNPQVTGAEVLLAFALLSVVSVSKTKPDWKIIGLSVIAICCALYHLFYFFIGTEFFLIWSSVALIREYSRDA